MDQTKLRVFAGAGGVLFGFTGLVALSVALIIVLSDVMGLALAVTSVALVFVGFGGLGIYLFLLPHRSSRDELDSLEDAGADALADLPVDTLKSFVGKRPIAAMALAVIIGYGLIDDPKGAGRKAQRLFLGML